MAKAADCGREGRMALAELVARTRTVRRFREEAPLAPALLEQLVDLARLGGSARNAQSLCYLVVTEPALRAALFPLLAWAGSLPDWPGPAAGERPAAYVVCVLDRERQRGPESEAHFDLGIGTQNLLLGAAERGVMGCRIGAFPAAKVRTLLQFLGGIGWCSAGFGLQHRFAVHDEAVQAIDVAPRSAKAAFRPFEITIRRGVREDKETCGVGAVAIENILRVNRIAFGLRHFLDTSGHDRFMVAAGHDPVAALVLHDIFREDPLAVFILEHRFQREDILRGGRDDEECKAGDERRHRAVLFVVVQRGIHVDVRVDFVSAHP